MTKRLCKVQRCFELNTDVRMLTCNVHVYSIHTVCKHQKTKDGCSALKSEFKQEVSQTRFLLNGHRGAIYVDIKRNVTDKEGETAYLNF